MSSVRNMSFDQFADKFTHDTEHILEFVGNLGHGRTERRSLQVYALRKLVEKHARKAGIDLQPQGKLNINFIIAKTDFFQLSKTHTGIQRKPIQNSPIINVLSGTKLGLLKTTQILNWLY